MSIRTLIDKMKSVKNKELIIAILIIAVIVSIYLSTIDKSSSFSAEEKNTKEDLQLVNQQENIESDMELKLEKKLSAIQGAGEVEVMITYKSGKEIVTAFHQVESNTTTEEKDNSGGTRKITQTDVNSQPVTMSDAEGSKPLVLKEVEPEVKGVIVIAEGASDLMVKIELRRAVQTALGLDANQVEVFVMEQNQEKE